MEGDPDERLEIKRWLRDLRKQRGISQAEVAQRVGVRRESVWNAESADQGLPSALPLLRMLRLYGVVSEAPVAVSDSLDVRLQALVDTVDALVLAVGEMTLAAGKRYGELDDRLDRIDDRLAEIERRLPRRPSRDDRSTGDSTAEGGMS